jgi:hypothetical protein
VYFECLRMIYKNTIVNTRTEVGYCNLNIHPFVFFVVGMMMATEHGEKYNCFVRIKLCLDGTYVRYFVM